MLISTHLGHLGEQAAHDHWIAAGAIAAIGVAAALGWLKKDKGEKSDPEVETEDALEEAEA